MERKQGKYRAYNGKVKYLRPRVYRLPDDYDPEREIAEALQTIEEEVQQ